MDGKTITPTDAAGNGFDAYLGATRLGAHECTFELFDRALKG